MGVTIVFETHSTTEDNERGIATGWFPGRLSEVGRRQARELGERRANDGIDAIFSSDLARARETTEVAFPDAGMPTFFDWRLRECNYGERNGTPSAELDRGAHVVGPYPGGESWQHAVNRMNSFLADLRQGWSGRRVLLIGHTATRWALDHHLLGFPVRELVEAPFDWQPGWEYAVS